MPLKNVERKIVYHIHNGDWDIGEIYHIGENDIGFPNVSFDQDYDCFRARSDEMRGLQEKGAIIDWTGKNTSDIFYLHSIIERMKDSSCSEDIRKDLTNFRDNLKKIQHVLIKENAPGLSDVIEEYEDLVVTLQNYLLLIREYVFEEVRKKSYPSLP